MLPSPLAEFFRQERRVALAARRHVQAPFPLAVEDVFTAQPAPSWVPISIGCWQNDVEDGAVWDGRRSPQASAMGLHDRPADGQSHPHPVWLGCKKGVEDAFNIKGIDSRS